MKFLVEKRNYFILLVIILLIIWIVFMMFFQNHEHLKTFNFQDKMITIKIYNNINEKEVYNEIENIYNKYENIDFTDGIDETENALIEYGKILYAKSLGYVDITAGTLIKKIQNNEEYKFTSQIEELDENIENLDINLDSILSSYATSEVIDYFRHNNIKKYLINEDGNITCGDGYNGKYVLSASYNEELLDIIYLENKSMATRNKSDEIESYMINPKTSKVTNNFDSVVVIANDNLTANMIANTLYLMDLEEGKKFISDYNAEAIWYTHEKIETTDGIENYTKN